MNSFLSHFFGVEKGNNEIHVFVNSDVSPTRRCMEKIPFSVLEREQNEMDITFTGNMELVSARFRDDVNVAFGNGAKKQVYRRRGRTQRTRPPSKKAPSVRTRKLGKTKRTRTTNVTASVKVTEFSSLMLDWARGVGRQESLRNVSWDYSDSNTALLTRLKRLGVEVAENELQLTSL